MTRALVKDPQIQGGGQLASINRTHIFVLVCDNHDGTSHGHLCVK